MISNKEIDVTLLNITQSQIKYLYADCHGYSRISPIKRTRKRQIDKHGDPIGKKFFFQTFGQAIKSYIKQSANESDIKSFEELAAFIDEKLKSVELKINQVLEEE